MTMTRGLRSQSLEWTTPTDFHHDKNSNNDNDKDNHSNNDNSISSLVCRQAKTVMMRTTQTGMIPSGLYLCLQRESLETL